MLMRHCYYHQYDFVVITIPLQQQWYHEIKPLFQINVINIFCGDYYSFATTTASLYTKSLWLLQLLSLSSG